MPSYILWPLAIIGALFLFSLAVFIHEFGHFIAARLLGLKADVFSIGFGPALWKKQIRGTELRFSAIPFGGYVSLPQLDPEGMQKLQGDHTDTTDGAPVEAPLPPAAPWKRIIVAIAGPLGNLVLALICASLIAWCAPEESFGASTTLGHVATHSTAHAEGLRTGDKILAVNDTPIASWHEFIQECYLIGGKDAKVTLSVQSPSEETPRTITLPLDAELEGKSDVYFIAGLLPAPVYFYVNERLPETLAAALPNLPEHGLLRVVRHDSATKMLHLEMVNTNFEDPRSFTLPFTPLPKINTSKTVIHALLDGYPAMDGGMRVGDTLLAIDGIPLTPETKAAFLNRADRTSPHAFLVSQGDEPKRFITLTPSSPATEERPSAFGFVMGPEIPGANEATYNFATTIAPSDFHMDVFRTLQSAGFDLAGTLITKQQFPWMKYREVTSQLTDDASGIFRVLQALCAPREGTNEASRAAKGLGGPVMIFSILTQLIANGLWISLGFLRLICINLAILNLLPLPVLDGGHTMFALYAIIRRKEPSAKVIGIVTNIFAFLLIGVMLWFLFSDIMRFIG